MGKFNLLSLSEATNLRYAKPDFMICRNRSSSNLCQNVQMNYYRVSIEDDHLQKLTSKTLKKKIPLIFKIALINSNKSLGKAFQFLRIQ